MFLREDAVSAKAANVVDWFSSYSALTASGSLGEVTPRGQPS